MSGPLGSQQWMYASGEAVQQSLKFNDDEGQYLSWTPAASGNRTTWTWSGWVKLGKITGSGYSVLFGASASLTNNDQLLLRMTSDEGQLFWRQEKSGVAVSKQNSTALFRDPSAWYHIVLAYDSTNATEVDRVKIYANGVQLELDNDNPTEADRQSQINHTVEQHIGYAPQVSDYFDGYMSDIHFIDGQALAPTSFGETVDGYWKAKDYDGTYGTNGYHLTFQDDVVSEGFNTVTYRGTGATQSISGLGFQNDFLWIKSRSDSAGTHRLIDSVRGGSLALQSDGTGTELDNSAQVTSPRDADGFTVAGNTSAFNQSGDTYVAWAWDAGSGSAASNTDGSVDSTVKANPDYGFSIVKWVGDGTSQGATVGHSLGVTPSMIFVKSTDSTASWNVWHKDLTNATTSRVLLNDDSDEFDSVYVWGSTAPDNSAFGVGTVAGSTWTNRSGRNYIAYCFAEVAGYSSIGSYTTDGSTTTVTTGFKPAFVIFKRTNADGDWYILDNTRFTSDDNNNVYLEPNTSDDETAAATNNLDFTDTGFVINSSGTAWNASSGEYIYMAFADTREAAFWKDVSGQGNHWTPINLDYRDSLIDSPANNFAVLNPLFRGSSNNRTLSEGNLKYQATSDDHMAGTFGVSSGKYYFEIFVNDIERSNNYFGIALETNRDTTQAVYYRSGSAQLVDALGGSATQTVADAVDGDIISIAVDLDGGSVQFKLNNSDLGTAISLQSGTYVPYTGAGNSTAGSKIWTFNFGQDSTFAGATTAGGNQDAKGIGDFKYAPPAGYLALCTDNLPTPTIIDGSEYFNTVLYTGDGTNNRPITGVSHQPSFTWIKNRSDTGSHRLVDVVRGATTGALFADVPNDEGNSPLVSFDADGFTLNNTTNCNNSGETYVAWNWKAGGTAVLNEVGTIDSQVSANTTAGFSIVSYTGTGVDGDSIGHGLTQAPELMFSKSRDNSQDWYVFGYPSGPSSAFTEDGSNLRLNEPTERVQSTVHEVSLDDSVITFVGSGHPNGSGDNRIAYCFHSVEGYSKVGSYTGNSSANGTFVYTGFRPAFILAKKYTDSDNWFIHDNKRVDRGVNSNAIDDYLRPDLSNDEGDDGESVDFLSNGFKWRINSGLRNQSGESYIYLAIAETPFKYANAR